MMGKAVFLLIGAAMLGATTLMFGGKQSSFESQAEQSEYQANVIARDIAESGYDEILSEIKREQMSAVGTRADVSMLGGDYDQAVTQNMYGDLNIQVDSDFEGVVHTIVSNVIFSTPFPAAVALSDDEIDAGGVGANYAISGMDERAPSRGGGGGFLRPVTGIVTDDGHVQQTAGSFAPARVVGSGNEDGSATVPSVAGGFDEAFYEAVYNEAKLHVNTFIDDTTPAGQRQSMIQSTASSSSPGNPKIIRTQGDLTINYGVEGHGVILVEDGDLNIVSNDFRWEGLVLVRKQNVDTVRINIGLDAEIYGSVVGYSATPGGGGGTQDCSADFTIVNHTETVVSDSFRVNVKVLGAAISYGGQYDMPVTSRMIINGQTFEPFGNWDQAISGNVNTGNSGAIYEWSPTDIFPPSSIRIDGRSWKKKRSRYSGTQNSHWKTYLTKNSSTVDDQLYALEDGDNVPSVGGYMGQYSVEDFLADYIDTDTDQLTLDNGQAMYLFELGSTNTASDAFDLQDLVVLITVVKASTTTSSSDDTATTTCTSSPGGTSRIEFNMANNAQVKYSPEALAKLGQTISTVANATRVVVAKDETYTNHQEGSFGGGNTQ